MKTVSLKNAELETVKRLVNKKMYGYSSQRIHSRPIQPCLEEDEKKYPTSSDEETEEEEEHELLEFGTPADERK